MKTQAARRPARKKPGLDLAPALSALAAAALAPAFGRALLAAIVAVGFLAASWRAKVRVESLPSEQIDRLELARAPLPSFLSDRARDDLADLDLPARIPAFHPGLVPALASELGKISWVDRVSSLTLDFEGTRKGEKLLPRLRFALEVARPIARIEEGGQELLVARSRRRVPLDRVVPGARSLPSIHGLSDSLEREPILDETLGLVAALEKNALSSRLGLVAVELSGREAVLVLSSGARVEWGPAGGLLPVEERVAALQLFLEKGPPLDQVERISVRWDDPVYVLTPVASAGTRADPR